MKGLLAKLVDGEGGVEEGGGQPYVVIRPVVPTIHHFRLG